MLYREGDVFILPPDTCFHGMLGKLTNRIHIYRALWIRKHLLPPPCRILDVGCHGGGQLCLAFSDVVNGNCLPLLPTEGVEIVGLEVKEELKADYEAQHPGASFHLMNIEDAPWPCKDNYFDNVLMGEVVEHIAEWNWPHVLSEAWRVCAGQVLMTLPMDGGIEITNRYSGGTGFDDHKFRPNLPDLKDLVDKYMPGHVLLEMKPVYHYTATEEYQKKYAGDELADIDLGFIYIRVIKKKWWASNE